MVMEASLTLEVGYYNSKLALWEPLVEPVTEFDSAGQLSYVPWELKVEVTKHQQHLLQEQLNNRLINPHRWPSTNKRTC